MPRATRVTGPAGSRRSEWVAVLGSASEQSEIHGAAYGRPAVGHAELLVDVRGVGLDGVDGDELRVGDLRVGEVRGEVAQDRLLAPGQRLTPLVDAHDGWLGGQPV